MAVIEIEGEALGQKVEWLFPNKEGGYCSGNVLGKSTRSYNGVLFSSPRGSGRVPLVREMEEKLILPQEEKLLSKNLQKFEWDPNGAVFHFSTNAAKVTKKVKVLSQPLGTEIKYALENFEFPLTFNVDLLLDPGKKDFNLWNEHTFGFHSQGDYVLVFSDYGRCFQNRPAEERRELSLPAHFSLKLRKNEQKEFKIIALSSPSQEEALEEFKKIELRKKEREREKRVLSSGPGIPIFTLLSTAQHFIMDRKPKLGIIAGYPFYGEKGTETMLALPGLTLIGSNFKSAELILERFLNKATPQGIPSEFVNGEPQYENNLEVTLWLVDRLYQYMQYTGEEKFKPFLHTYWWNLKDIFENYSEKEKQGLLKGEGKTWMHEKQRTGAVETQGLWYNSLKIMEKFSEVMDDYAPKDKFSSYAEDHAQNFLQNFRKGDYLKDSLEDDAFTPNQIIVLSLDFNVIPEDLARKILHRAEKELVTPYGLRTLSKDSRGYQPESKFEGGAWPWLLGPFITAYVKYFPQERKGSYRFIRNLFEEEVKRNCLGTIGEFFNPETGASQGNLSYSASLGELLRTYFEDILGKKGVPRDKI